MPTSMGSTKEGTMWKVWYAAACTVRVMCIFLPGYVHPDEFFQSTEVAASDALSLGTMSTIVVSLYCRMFVLAADL